VEYQEENPEFVADVNPSVNTRSAPGFNQKLAISLDPIRYSGLILTISCGGVPEVRNNGQ